MKPSKCGSIDFLLVNGARGQLGRLVCLHELSELQNKQKVPRGSTANQGCENLKRKLRVCNCACDVWSIGIRASSLILGFTALRVKMSARGLVHDKLFIFDGTNYDVWKIYVLNILRGISPDMER